jgi:hypothetical protein
MDRQSAILDWFRLFPEAEADVPSFDSLKDGITIVSLYGYLSGVDLPPDVPRSTSATGSGLLLALKRLRFVTANLKEFHSGTMFDLSPDITAIATRGVPAQLEVLCSMLIAYSLKSPKQSEVQSRMKTLSPDDRSRIAELVPLGPDHLTVLNDEIARLQSSNAELRLEIDRLTEQSKDLTPEEEALIASANAQIFAEEVRNQTKQQRLQGLRDIENRCAVLLCQIESLNCQASELEVQLRADESRELDYSVLTDMLDLLAASPALAAVRELTVEKKTLKRTLRQVFAERQKWQAKLESQQNFTILTERRIFLTHVYEANVKRRERAVLNLMLAQKKMRQDLFQAEMQTFL